MPAIPSWSACLLLMLSGLAAGEVRLPSILSDHAVLQRSGSTVLWGWASPGEKVAVHFSGRSAGGITDADGRWEVALDLTGAERAPSTLTVKGAGDPVEVKDVIVGELWLSSGQSNMQFTLNATDGGWEEIGRSKDTELRWFMAEAGRAFEEPRGDVRGAWKVAGPETSGDCGGVPYYFGKNLRRDLEVPVGLILTAVGGSTIQSWMSSAALDGEEDLRKGKERAMMRLREEEPAKGKKKKGKRLPPQETSSFYYNQMIHPLRTMTLKGIIWYQGESHFNQEKMYGRAFPLMIRSWRLAFGQGDLPFHFCQLPNMEKKGLDPGDAGWIAGLREAQSQALHEPSTGQVTLIDAGEEDFHPTDKKTVGERLAWQVEERVYGKKNGAAEYPHMAVTGIMEGGRVAIDFGGCPGGLVARELPREDIAASGGIPDSPVQGFAVRGADGKWHWARAGIRGIRVEVWSPEVPVPEEIRYAWSNNPTCNLANKAGLPVAPFRTALTTSR